MIRRLRKGDRPFRSLHDWEELRNSMRSNTLATSTAGVSLAPTPRGGLFTFEDPLRTRWVYVVGLREDGKILAKEAVSTPVGDVVYDDNHIVAVSPAPGYTVEHFALFVIDGPQPAATDRACKMEAGRIVPDFRMLLIEPAAVEDLCEPCKGSP